MQPDARSFYYLLNFERALAWLSARYADLLAAEERDFIAGFAALPLPSRALLVRMLMRKGNLFRASRLVYPEIGSSLDAAAPLVGLGWLERDPTVDADELGALLTRTELLSLVGNAQAQRTSRKTALVDAVRAAFPEAAQPYSAWGAPDIALSVTIAALCERLRLLFFGNLHQTWSEFVLADLGVYQYEAVSFEPSARAFQQRADVDAYLALAACRDALELLAAQDPHREPEAAAALFVEVMSIEIAGDWLEMRRAKLLYRLGYRAEQIGAWSLALDAYAASRWPDARYRRARVLERRGCFSEAFDMASRAACAPESEAEQQRLARMLPRLRRRLGLPVQRPAAAPRIERSTLVLDRPEDAASVEEVVRNHLHVPDAPTFYVENALINSLFGLLCWEAVFAPLPGAFFHPFQRGPADLHAPDFRTRRAERFAQCFSQLESGAYRTTITRHMQTKAGIQSPFVFWGVLTPELVSLALDCLPAEHLKHCFARLSDDIRANRSGLPDLIRFWPAEKRYELIEVKGPGDRLQDNQIRWLAYCARVGIPVSVVDVRWREAAAAAEAAEAAEAATAIEPAPAGGAAA
ncbi:VRR-NUC domain-containing protein [Trinickia caryophylli]|uniref:phosphodiesterase I n=1 Tax=Trinickia caryophylli TaxID=28094 RepID=A0A1X7DNP4_TRICW|nr:VRR-NUC domain-containing protein [Trinickia caryophylli]PMS10620.1 VRR-NUC domain-containing protein [Trinickia caryophylli]TRX17202.1 VRR-NUC domain-containing protein [Trinickia caryophylli]WQE12064.1 VRR-NUC domain-containing protein [Trinickia caryophylli]SMF18657.1 VRR-NUC domain-containing protein [Trinickia caryophylli]GLU31813.1 hypothetical protein Busp01_16550 [Trinickia caryophylli]